MEIRYVLLTFLIGALGCADSNKSKLDNEKKFIVAYNVATDIETANYEVFTIDFNGETKRNLTNHPDVAWTYLGGKDKVYFISDRDTCTRCYFLYQTDSKGNHIKKISNVRLKDSWMSSRNNGSQFIINPHQSIDTAFYIIDTLGNLVKRLPLDFAYFNDPCFSPDGKQIVFRASHKKFKKENGFIDELYIMDSDGNNIRQLTHYPVEDSTAAWYNYKAGPPRWNPKENFITYQSFQKGKYSLYAVIPDNAKQWKLTDNIQNEGWHDWSSDGKWLAIDVFDSAQTQFHIILMNWETKAVKYLTDTTYKYQQAPSFVEISGD